MHFSVRAYNCLKRAGIDTLGEIADLTMDKLLQIRNLGQRAAEEIVDKLRAYGLNLQGETEGLSNEIKLLPCPFCGGEAEKKMYLWGHRKESGKPIWCFYVFCTSCDSMGDNVFKTKQEAFAAWNHRIPDIVHCGECAKMMTTECPYCSFDHEGYCTGGPESDQYCSFGKRREAAT
jgi:Lar family restriction alleviation protein